MQRRRLLLVTYYFPPSGGPGVQRPLKFVRYLSEFGWDVTVLTVHPAYASYPGVDASLEGEVPEHVEVVRTRAWDPYTLYARLLGKKKEETISVALIGDEGAGWKQSLARSLRGSLFVPDARVGWVPYASRRGRSLLRDRRFDALVSTGPPQSVHLVGRALRRRTGLPWVADFRDPWMDISYYQALRRPAPARRLDAALERSVLNEASAVLTVSPSIQKLLAAKTPVRVCVIPNGYDEADFEGVEPVRSEDFVLAHVGNLSESQNPDRLWKVLGALRREGEFSRLRIRFVGNVDAAVLQSVRASGLDGIVEQIAYVPHEEAIRYMLGATVLLLCINRVPDSAGIVTGKLFEYLASGRPVLGVGPADGDAAAILEKTAGGTMCDWSDEVSQRRSLMDHYGRWNAGEPLCGASPDRALLYSRRTETASLVALLDALVDRKAHRDCADLIEERYW